MTAGFAVSYAALCGAQAGTAAVSRDAFEQLRDRFGGRAWAVVPAGSIAVVVAGLALAPGAAKALTYLALVAVPVLAVCALAWVVPGAGRWPAFGAVPLVALAFLAPRTLAGGVAATVLEGLSCATLAALLASVAPRDVLRAGILAMALVDSALVVSDLLQQPNSVLNAAAPGGGLPQLQRALVGSAVMGYGDLFAAALLGSTLHREGLRGRGALLLFAMALAFGALFNVVDELPATVPCALALIVALWSARVRRPPGHERVPA
jgi:hypothetical protein